MSTPFTSPQPDMPTGTSNPVSWKSWFTKIGDWITRLSPPSAAAYDTGWMQDNSLFSPGTGWGSPIFVYRRIGKLVYIYVQVTATAIHTVNTGTGAMSNSQYGTILETSIRPDGPDIGYGLSGGNTRITSAFVTRSGAVGASIGGTAQVDVGNAVRAYGMYPIA